MRQAPSGGQDSVVSKPLIVVLLPGLDGSGLLFQQLVDRTPPGFSTQVIAYPGDEVLRYAELEPLVRAQLPDGPYLLVGESYSSPLAVKLAARPTGDLRGLVLAAGFVTAPARRFWRLLPWRAAFALPAPASWLRWVMGLGTGSGVDRLRVAVGSASTKVLAARVREALEVDVREELSRVRCPLLYLAAAHDRVVPQRCAREVLDLHRAAMIETLDVGHPVLQLTPEAAWRELGTFVQQQVGRDSGRRG